METQSYKNESKRLRGKLRDFGLGYRAFPTLNFEFSPILKFKIFLFLEFLDLDIEQIRKLTCGRRPNPKRKGFVKNDHLLLMTIFQNCLHQSAPVEDNTVSKCIRTVAAKYGCKILQLY